MAIPNSPAGRQTRTPRRSSSPGQWGRDIPLNLLELENRSVPSVNLPLSGTEWTELGPRPIAAQRPGEATSSPGNLTSTGRLAGVAAHPTNPDIVYVAAAGGGVAKTTDGGETWTELTDRLPGLTDDQRNLNMGSISVSPVLNAQGEYNVYAGGGELVFSGDAYTGKGILKSSDGGKSWSLIEGPGQAFVDVGIPKIVTARNPATGGEIVYAVITGSRVGALGLDGYTTFPGASTVYGQPKPNGVYRSTNGGQTWTNITAELNTGINQVSPDAAITDFTVDPNNPSYGFVAVGDPGFFNPGRSYALNGVYKTTTALAPNPTWTVAFGGNGTFVPGSKLGRIQVEIAASRPSTVFVTVHDPATDGLLGVFRSKESGINFRQIQNVPDFLPAQGFYNLAMLVDPTDANRLYLAGGPGGAAGSITGIVAATDAADAGNINEVNLTWSNIGLNGPGGAGPHVDQHDLELDAAGRLLVGNDGGLFRTVVADTGATAVTAAWESMNGVPGPNALNVTEYVGVGLHPQSAEEMFGGTQDNGLHRFFDDGDTSNPTMYGWAMANGGDAGDFVYDNKNPQYMYHTAPYGNARVSKSEDFGKTWQPIMNGITNAGKGLFYPPLEMDPSNSKRLFMGEDDVYETKNGGTSWAPVGTPMPYVTGINPPGQHAVTAISVGRADGNVIYAAVSDRWQQINGVWVNFGPALYQYNRNLTPRGNGFPAWVDVSPGVASVIVPPLPNAPPNPLLNDLQGPITDIAVDPFDSNIVYITVDVDGFGAEKVYRSVDGVWVNGPPPTWDDITGSGATALPRRAYSVAIDPNLLRGDTDDDVYVGTEIGVYVWRNPTTGTPNWERVGGDSFPDVRVTDVEINTTIGILAAGTYGRGVWQLQIRPLISGYKFEDVNGNGIRDFTDADNDDVYDIGEAFTEPGLSGFTIITTNLNTNAEQASTTTRDPDGYWEFRSLPDDPFTVDRYRLREALTPPQALAFQQTSYDLPDYIDLDRFDTYTFQNIGNFRRTSISGVKFDDTNGDGVRDAGEPGLQGWTIQLLNAETGAVVATRVTGAGGAYSFDNLGILQAPDPTPTQPNRRRVVPYTLREVNQAGWIQTRAAGGNITLTSGTPSTGNDFGNFKVFSIRGVKYEDLNGNGRRDTGEPGLAGWTFRLLNATTNQPILNSAGQPVQYITGADGSYVFNNLRPRDANNNLIVYRVREVLQPGWAQVSVNPADVPPESGQTLSGGDFGNFRLVTVSGSVFDDTNGDGLRSAGENTPVAGGTARLFNTVAGFSVSAPIQADGTFSFPNLQPIIFNGTLVPFSIDITPANGYVRTTALPPAFTVSSGQSVTGVEFGVFKTTFIRGYLFTDTNGNGVQDGTEAPGLGAAGSKLELLNGSTGAVVATISVGANGLFTLPNLAPIFNPGTNTPYRIRVTAPGGYVLTTPPESKNYQLQSGVPVEPVTFGVFELVSISGQVFDDKNGDGTRQAGETAGVPGAKVTLIDSRNGSPVAGTSTVTVGANGKFTFANLGPLLSNNINSPYRVQVAPPAGWVLTAPDATETVVRSGSDVQNVTFAGFKLISVSGVAYDDKNANKVQDAGEPGLENWTVTLRNLTTGATATVVTDNTGAYSFPSLGPGVYQVRQTLQDGYIQLTPDPADAPAVSGVDVGGVSFADFKKIALSGKVVEDLDRDGVLEAGEPGRSGWVVNLVDGSGQLIATDTTDADGNFAFPDLGPGSYAARIVLQPGYIRTTDDPAFVTAVSGTDSAANSFGVLRLGSIQSIVFQDSNRNGIQDPNEPVLPDVQVSLLNAQNEVIAKTTTAADGSFQFLNLEPGKYSLQFLYGPAGSGFVFSNPDFPYGIPITLTAGSGSGGNNFVTPLGISASPTTVVGADRGGGPHVQVYDALTNSQKGSFFAYDASFTGGVRVAQGDVTGDGVPDVVTVVGPGGGPEVKVFDGVTYALVYSFMAYETSFTGGMFVAAGDINGDGIADIVTGTDIGGGPRVQAFDGKTKRAIQNYFAYESSFRGGVRVATGDINGDGVIDIITTPAEGGGPRVTAFSGDDLRVLANFFAFDNTDRAGVYVAAGDLNRDNVAEIIVGQGAADNPLVRTYTGAGTLLASAPAFPPDEFGNTFRSEVRVAVTDRYGDGNNDVVVTSGPGSLTRLRYLDANLVPTADELRPYDQAFTGGVYVG